LTHLVLYSFAHAFCRGDKLIAFRLAVLGKIKDVFLDFLTALKVALINDQFIAKGCAFGNDFSGWRDNTTAADQIAAFLASGLGNANHPGAVLIGAGLHDKMVVKVLQVIVLRRRWIMNRSIIAQQHKFHP